MAIRFLDEEVETQPGAAGSIRFLEEGEVVPGEQPQGLIAKAKDLFTGESRTTPEIEGLQGIGELPELNEMSLASFKSAFNTVMSDPEEAVQALQANFPGIEVRKDEKGNLIVRSGVSGQEFLVNKPGLDTRDVIRGALTAGLFAAPVARGAGLAARVGGAALTQAGIEGTQEATGGQFDPEQIPLAAGTELIAPGVGAVARKAKAAIPGGKAALSAAEEAVQSAERAGVTPLTSDILPPTTQPGKVGQALAERIPFVGTGPVRVKQQAQRVDAVRDTLRQFGASDVAQASDDVMKEVLEKRGKDLTKFSKFKNDVIEKLSDKGVVDISNTSKTLDDEIIKLNSLKTKGVQPVINIFEDFKTAIKDQDLGNIEELRKQLGEQLTDPNLAAIRKKGEKVATKVYKALNEEMGDFIKANGERRDFTKWKVGNKQLSKMIKETSDTTLKSVLKKGNATPEVVRRMLFSKKPSEVRLLYKSLTPEGRNRAKTAIFQEIAEKAGGVENVTPEKFIREMRKFEKSTKVFLSKEDKQAAQGLIKALELTKQAPIAAAKPTTGAEVTAFVAPSALSWLIGGSPAAGVAAVGGIGATARAYESKAVRNLLLRLAKTKPGEGQEILNKLTPLLQSFREQATTKKESE